MQLDWIGGDVCRRRAGGVFVGKRVVRVWLGFGGCKFKDWMRGFRGDEVWKSVGVD